MNKRLPLCTKSELLVGNRFFQVQLKCVNTLQKTDEHRALELLFVDSRERAPDSLNRLTVENAERYGRPREFLCVFADAWTERGVGGGGRERSCLNRFPMRRSTLYVQTGIRARCPCGTRVHYDSRVLVQGRLFQVDDRSLGYGRSSFVGSFQSIDISIRTLSFYFHG